VTGVQTCALPICCELAFTRTIAPPFPLSASAGVSRDASCDPDNGAEVRVTNVVGGTLPYSYSFDGGGSYGSSSIQQLHPGTYTVMVKDARDCIFPMSVTVEDIPTPPIVTLTPEVSYDCIGEGFITVGTDIATYDYIYELLDSNGNLIAGPQPENEFPQVAPGNYTVRTTYTSQTPPTPSLLLSEDFGSGGTIPSPNTVGYQYEDQTVNPPGDNNQNINDYEYSVTSNLVAPFPTWANPIDHTSGTKAGQGRYLVINIGAPAPGQIIYSKTINDVIHNQPLRVSLEMLNLMRVGTSGADVDLTIDIREIGTGTVVATTTTGAIPKNTGNSNWVNRTVELNPGTNSSLEFVIRTEMSDTNGNDVAIDDIEVYQIPEVCERIVETTVIVEPNQMFEAEITSVANATCYGESNGSITFEVTNFNVTEGFEYSLDGWVTSTISINSPVTITTGLGAGDYTLDIRYTNDLSREYSLRMTRSITALTQVQVTANITSQYTCTNGGATITASASGGTPGYEYQLEDESENIIGAYDFAANGSNTIFTGILEGDYVVRVRDIRSCDDATSAVQTVEEPEELTFTATPIACYSGNNDGEVVVTVTGGNGGLLFRINGGPFQAPNPVTADTYTFTNLGSGDHTIEVKDQFGCTVAAQIINIAPELSVTASAPAITACAPSTDVTISAIGGSGTYVYAVLVDNIVPTDSDFSTT